MRTLAGINGRSGLINFLEIVPHSVLAIDTKGEQIRAILHPEKLSRLPAMSPNDVGTAIRSRVRLGNSDPKLRPPLQERTQPRLVT